MDYTQDGTRTITDLYFDVTETDESISLVAQDYKESHDEVYIIIFDPNDFEFIYEIVTSGCRL